MSHRRTLPALLCGFACIAATAVVAEPAIGQFELKSLDSEPGSYEFQSQNAWSWGQPSRQVQMNGPDEFVADENAVIQQRYAQELEMGLSDRLKMRVGLELEKERIDDPQTLAELDDFEPLKLQELGTELIAILIPREGDGAALGIVTEFELPLTGDESAAMLIGPVIEFQSGPWFAAAMPAFVRSFGGDPGEGEEADDKWDFTYATQFSYRFSDTWTLALEGYGTIDRIGNTGHRSEAARIFGDFDQHRLGPIMYFAVPLGPSELRAAGELSGDDEESESASLSVGLGVLAGINGHTPGYTLKLSIEVDY